MVEDRRQWQDSSFGVLRKVWLVQWVTNCRLWGHFFLELKVILTFLKVVLLVFFLYKVVKLKYLNTTVRVLMTKVVAVLVEDGWAVLCWDLWLSLCRRW